MIDESGHWYRPVSGHGSGELSYGQCLNPTTRQPLRPLDVVIAHMGKLVPSPYQPEDLITPGIWHPADVGSVGDLRRWLESAVDHTSDFLTRDRVDRIAEVSVATQPLASSLALVRPDELRLKKTSSFSGRPQVRASFSSSDIRGPGGATIPFDLVVTDDLWEERVKKSDDDDVVVKERGSDDEVFVTVSLGVPFNGYHYKLVAAIITDDEIVDAMVRNGSEPHRSECHRCLTSTPLQC